MIYPIEILPDQNRKLISCDISKHFLIRSTKTNIPSDLRDDVTGEIYQRTICSPSENIVDLSTSIFGVFSIQHNLIELTSKGKLKYGSYCEPDINVEIPLLEIDFSIDNEKGFWVILIEKICNQLVEYTFGDIPNRTFTAQCAVVHTPALWNFWHYSVKWFLIDYDCYLDRVEDVKLKSKIAKRLSGEARAMIAKFAKVIEPDYQELHLDCYLKDSSVAEPRA